MVSILIPNFNNANWLQGAIESCIMQGELLHEIILVDDHSIDDSIKIVNELQSVYPGKIKLYKNPEKGANSARNYAFTHSSGKYIQWLDGDDILLAGKFDAQIKALESSDADIAYSDFRFDYFEGSKVIRSETKSFSSVDDYLEELLREHWNACHSYLIKREFATNLDDGIGWNSSTKVGQDREYFTMAGILGAKFIYVPGVYAVYNKQNAGTISNMVFNRRLELNQILEGRFRKEIKESEIIPPKKKKYYFKILDTHKVKACFYNREIKFDHPISPFDIQWSLVHWKMKPFILFILISHYLKIFLDGYKKN